MRKYKATVLVIIMENAEFHLLKPWVNDYYDDTTTYKQKCLLMLL